MVSEVTSSKHSSGTDYIGGVAVEKEEGKRVYTQRIDVGEDDGRENSGHFDLSAEHSGAVVVQDNVNMANSLSNRGGPGTNLYDVTVTQGHEGKQNRPIGFANFALLSGIHHSDIQQLGDTDDLVAMYSNASCNRISQGNGDDVAFVAPTPSSFGNRYDGGAGYDVIGIYPDSKGYHLQDTADSKVALIDTETGALLAEFTNYEAVKYGEYDDVPVIPLEELREQGLIQPAADDEMIGSGVERLLVKSCGPGLQLSS